MQRSIYLSESPATRYPPTDGRVAERFKAPVLKTGDGQPSVGSNPTSSATPFKTAGARGFRSGGAEVAAEQGLRGCGGVWERKGLLGLLQNGGERGILL